MKYILLPIVTICLISYLPAYGQDVTMPSDSSINITQDSNRVSFSVKLPSLTQIPGAPAPFYTYLWDFGDGHFSTAENPVHAYGNLSDYDVHLYAVNNYDDGKKPQRKKIKVTVDKAPPKNMAAISPAEKDFFKANGIFELKYNCMAKPNDTMVLIAGWKNTALEKNQGKLYLLVNEKSYEQTCFDTVAFRFYNQDSLAVHTMMAALNPLSLLTVTESGSPASNIIQTINNTAEAQSLLAKTFTSYKNSFEIDLGEMQSGTTQFSFTELYVTPEMIKDTNATLTITGVYVPKKGNPVMHRLNIPVVNSHDPNKMNLNGGRLFYRFIKKHQPLTYKVRFQNTGEGPARKVALDMTMPETLDPQSITVKDMYPYCPPCDSVADKRGCWEIVKNEKGAVFTFNGIYLPGTNQKGVEDKDSTKGFMQFGIVSKKRLENKPFKAQTAIYFDKNEPIITNYATGRFHKGVSPVVMAGYEIGFGNGKASNGIVTGFGIAPIAPRLPYLQFELYYKQGLATTTNTTLVNRSGTIFVDSIKREFQYENFDSSATYSINQIKLIPAQLRYNINKYVSVGAGAIVSADMGGYTQSNNIYNLFGLNSQGTTTPYQISIREKIKSFSNIKARPFFDLQLGLVKWGPHVGFRYYYYGKENSYGFIYAGVRF
ncbi:MAG: PKD domain-containing protein [Niabella sp.]